MAPLPKPRASTVAAIYRAYEDANQHYDSLGISVGLAATECDRSLWYTFRWASNQKPVPGRNLSIFRTGDVWEERLVADLERIGVEVYGQQDRIRLVGGHVRGKCDGKGIGLPEAPKTEHLFEFKSSNDKGFKEIVKKGCKVARPLHFGQVQLGMHAFGLPRAGYLVVNKNDDERHFERIEYDAEWCIRLLARLERIINMPEPPSRVSDNPEFFGCRFCDHRDICHEGGWPRVSCRSCLHSTPEMHGDAHWSCARWAKPLSVEEQKASCPAHLTIPALVPGELVDSDEDSETITYKLRSGRLWTDGASDDTDATNAAA